MLMQEAHGKSFSGIVSAIQNKTRDCFIYLITLQVQLIESKSRNIFVRKNYLSHGVSKPELSCNVNAGI